MPFIKCWRVVVENWYFSVNSALWRRVPNQQTALHWGLIYGQVKWKVNWLEMVFQMWIQWCPRSLLSYHLSEDMLLTLLRFPLWAWRVYFTQVSAARLQLLDGWRDTEKYWIAYFKTDCLLYTLIKMEKKSQSHFFNMLLLTALINLVSAASK